MGRLEDGFSTSFPKIAEMAGFTRFHFDLTSLYGGDIMHSISDLRDYFSWTYPQARKRVILLQEDFNHEVKGGENRKYLVTDNGFKLLERLHELEKDGHGLKSGLSQIKEEMESSDTNGKNLKVKSVKIGIKYVERLEQENQFLKQEIERLHNLLPAGSTNGKGILRRIWERIW